MDEMCLEMCKITRWERGYRLILDRVDFSVHKKEKVLIRGKIQEDTRQMFQVASGVTAVQEGTYRISRAGIIPEQFPDLERMREAADILSGMHDFRSLCGNSHMKKSTVRVVDSIEIRQKGPYLRFVYHGNGFLQNMVRIMTGTLLEVGYGKRTAESMQELLEARDRKLAGPTAPAQGLCMMEVQY